MPVSRDLSELLFRLFFSGIFLGLGLEHIFADDLIQRLMPLWVPAPRAISILWGLALVAGGACVLLGWQLRHAALALGALVVIVTLTVHLPALFSTPASIPTEGEWLWVILQRSNFAKNLCLLGVCLHLLHHETGRYSLSGRRLD